MKKYALLLLLSIPLVGCSNKLNSSQDSTTISSLTEENAKLKTENSELSERIAALTSTSSSSSSSSSSKSSSSSQKTGNFKLGQSAEFTSGESVTVSEVKADDSITLNEPVDGEHPVVVTAVVENTTDSPIYFNAHSFDLYDGNSELCRMDASTYGNNIPNEIAGKKKATIVMHFSAKGNAPYSVTYGPATWNE